MSLLSEQVQVGDYVSPISDESKKGYALNLGVEGKAPSVEVVWLNGQREYLPYHLLEKSTPPKFPEGTKLCNDCHIPMVKQVVFSFLFFSF